jgi:hypothetical protein
MISRLTGDYLSAQEQGEKITILGTCNEEAMRDTASSLTAASLARESW